MNKLNVGDYVDVSGLNEAQKRALGRAMVLAGVKEPEKDFIEDHITGGFISTRYWFVNKGGNFDGVGVDIALYLKTQRTPEEIMFLNAPDWAKCACSNLEGKVVVWVESLTDQTSRYRRLGTDFFTDFGHNWNQHHVLFTRPEQAANFTPENLQDGMRCYHKDGTESIVVGEKLWIVESDDYEERSLHVHVKDYSNNFSIDELYLSSLNTNKVTDRGVVVWERPTAKAEPEQKLELTLEDIAKKYGVDVGDIRIKD